MALPGNPLVFLSHAGVDTDRAKALKGRLERAPSAEAAGLKVWLDKDDLKPGTGWQAQLESVIQNEATAFVVYVGSRGIINWVESEVRLGVARAVARKDFPFIPVIAKELSSEAALPGFVGQFQGVKDVENDDAAFKRLVAALLGTVDAGPIKAEKEPFFGLKSIDEEHSYLFFGREQETREVLTRLGQQHLVMVIGDSGSGKSSLIRAGVVSKWRGGALANPGEAERDESYWHVIQFRPGRDPWESLGNAVSDAAILLGTSAEDRGTYFKWVTEGDIEFVRLGLRCGLASERTQTLVVIDQFEELFTSRTTQQQRRRFVDAVVSLLDDPSFYIVMTMRRDYYNLLAAPETRPLFGLIESEAHVRRYSLRRMTDDGLRRIVLEPLKLTDENPQQALALANAVLDEVGDRPGDLALVEFALTKAWERRNQGGGTLLESYTAIGGVEGALAGEAERVYGEVLGGDANEKEISATLMRLAQLTGGAGPVRRMARRREFSESRWEILQLLASRNGNRLVLIAGQSETDDNDASVEIAHEALFIRWPRLFAWLNVAEADKRILENLTERAIAWADEKKEKKDGRLAKSDAERESFQGLATRHGYWLSEEEKNFVAASVKANDARLARERALRWGAWAAAIVATILAVVAGLFGAKMYVLQQQQAEALEFIRQNDKEMRRQQSRLLARFANEAIGKDQIFSGARFALAGLDRLQDRLSSKSEAANALTAAGAQILPNLVSRHSDEILAVQWDNRNHAVLSLDRKLVLDRATYEQPAPAARFIPVFPGSGDRGEGTIVALAVARGTQAVAILRELWGPDGNNLEVWKFVSDGTKGRKLCRFKGYSRDLLVKWAPDDKRVAVASNGILGVCAESDAPIWVEAKGATRFAWSPNSDQIAFASDRGVEVLSNMPDVNSRVLLPAGERVSNVSAIAWTTDGKRVTAATQYGMSQLWHWANVDGAWAKPELQRGIPQGQLFSIEWSPDSDRLALIVDNNGYPSRELRPFMWTRSKQISSPLENSLLRPFSERSPDRGSTSAVAWSRDGRLASFDTYGIDCVVQVRNLARDTETVSVVLALGRREQPVIASVAWAGDDRLVVAALLNSEINVWLLPKETSANPIPAPIAPFGAEHAHISSDGSNLVASGRNGSILFSKTAAGAAPRLLQPQQHVPKFVEITPDGAHLALVSKTGSIFHLERSKGVVRSIGQIPGIGNDSELLGAAMSNDGSHLAIVTQGPVKLLDYDLTSGAHSETLLSANSYVSSSLLAWSHNGSVLAVWVRSGDFGSTPKLRLFHYGDSRKTTPLREIPYPDTDLKTSEGIDALAWSREGRLAAAITDRPEGRPSVRQLVIWTNASAVRVADDIPAANWIDIRWQGEDRLVAGLRKESSGASGGSSIVFYGGDSFAAGKPLDSGGDFVGFLASPSAPAYRAALFRSGARVTMRDFNVSTETIWLDLMDRLPDNPLWTWADSGVLVWSDRDDGQVTAFDGTRTQELQSIQHTPLALAVSESGRIASVSAGRSLRVWKDPGSSPETIELSQRSYNRASVEWAPKDDYLAVSQGGRTLVFPRRDDGALDKPFEMSGGQAIAWSKNSKLAVAGAGPNGIQVEVCENMASCRTNSRQFSLPEPGLVWDTRLSLFWSEDSKRIAVTVGTKSYIKMIGFELERRGDEFTEIARVETSGPSAASAWSSDDRYLAASTGQRVYIWPQIDIDGLKARIAERITQSELTPEERRLAGFSDLR